MKQTTSPHSFHIPVMGLGFTVDTPLKVAKFGISSAVSIVDDFLLEDMRRIHSSKLGLPFEAIDEQAPDYKALRTTAYLNLLHHEVQRQCSDLRNQSFETDRDIHVYFELLPTDHPEHSLYVQMLSETGTERVRLQEELRSHIVPGSIDVNIMTKVDKLNTDKEGNPLPREYSDALTALRGFANSELDGSVIFSAGLNPALYSYAESFSDFFPDNDGYIKKRIILKVSDYRSALIQGRFLAKKGLWVSEFRVESGLNCGGHAFATDGYLIGPILEEFKTNRQVLAQTLREACNAGLQAKGLRLSEDARPKITYQGGIGNSEEDRFLLDHYELDGTGWGSPFLLVPEATSVDEDTLQRILASRKSDYYLSDASPLGVPFNNLRNSSAEEQRMARIQKNRAGSPCYKKFLSFSTEFGDKPICTASREYLHLKSKQQASGAITSEELEKAMEKDCLCEGLSAPAILHEGHTPRRNLSAVTICPGPNLAYFKGVFSLKEMVDHIYGKISLSLDPQRPHVFVKELQLYVGYIKREVEKPLAENSQKFENYVEKFKKNLLDGIQYYQQLIEQQAADTMDSVEALKEEFRHLQREVVGVSLLSSPVGQV